MLKSFPRSNYWGVWFGFSRANRFMATYVATTLRAFGHWLRLIVRRCFLPRPTWRVTSPRLSWLQMIQPRFAQTGPSFGPSPWTTSTSWTPRSFPFRPPGAAAARHRCQGAGARADPGSALPAVGTRHRGARRPRARPRLTCCALLAADCRPSTKRVRHTGTGNHRGEQPPRWSWPKSLLNRCVIMPRFRFEECVLLVG
jgi:hypothetical protein